MIKSYLYSLNNLFKEIGLFAKNNFKKYMLPIWFLIFTQILFGIPVLFVYKEIGFMNLSIGLKFVFIMMLGAFVYSFFLMFKEVYKMIADGLNLNKISNMKIIKSALVLTIFNIIPLVVFYICYYIASWIPSSEKVLKYIPGIFAMIFYFVMSLSLASIVKWQNKNVFVAILKSLKTFFVKIKYTLPLFLIIFILAVLITWVICTAIYAIFMFFNLLTYSLIDATHIIVNVCSLYIISGFYIGAQVLLLKDENE